jgi:hypothetical protein
VRKAIASASNSAQHTAASLNMGILSLSPPPSGSPSDEPFVDGLFEGGKVALVRPDRVIFGISRLEKAGDLLESLRRALHRRVADAPDSRL